MRGCYKLKLQSFWVLLGNWEPKNTILDSLLFRSGLVIEGTWNSTSSYDQFNLVIGSTLYLCSPLIIPIESKLMVT
ncbi:hypothetical protein EUGRSUZ_L02939 [Eucalyptus grandis]|uniref:Uncharacterized protein n=1 Tax=Eucalyptus grandis TaxID=71139 RepID=A0AAD9WIM7_EUCGR|nr:hypothetical protein EUGRSUZ_L02939 [Eucalyptus grandis]